MSDPTPAPAPTPAPQPDWFVRQEHLAATALHSILARLDPLAGQIEHDLAIVAHDTWQNAAAFAAAYLTRNRAEFGTKLAEAIVADLVAKVPGLAIEAPAISEFAVSELEKIFGVLIAEMQKEGHVIAPQPPAPTPAPEPASA